MGLRVAIGWRHSAGLAQRDFAKSTGPRFAKIVDLDKREHTRSHRLGARKGQNMHLASAPNLCMAAKP